MKLLVFAHKPPPHHGQSYMVQLMIEAFGGDCRKKRRGRSTLGNSDGAIECFHVDARLSATTEDIGRARLGKLFPLLRYCAEAIWCRYRYGISAFYYVPAPAIKSAIYRDWIVMFLCRPFFKRVIFHWEAVGLGEWLRTEARPWERFLTQKLLGHVDLSIVLGDFYKADAGRLSPKSISVVPNGIPDPSPDFDLNVRPGRLARIAAMARFLEGRAIGPDPCNATFKVLYLSLCSREKGIFDAVEAVAIANRDLAGSGSGLRIELIVAGEFYRESEHKEFEERIGKSDLHNEDEERSLVRYEGFVSGMRKAALFRECDCFCFPSHYPAEGHPVSLLEAMAFDLPIIATRWRAIPELFPPDYGGLVEIKSPTEIAKKIHWLLAYPFETESRKRFLQSFLQERFVEGMKSALQNKQTQVHRTGDV